jgi:hypothetical protein
MKLLPSFRSFKTERTNGDARFTYLLAALGAWAYASHELGAILVCS